MCTSANGHSAISNCSWLFGGLKQCVCLCLVLRARSCLLIHPFARAPLRQPYGRDEYSIPRLCCLVNRIARVTDRFSQCASLRTSKLNRVKIDNRSSARCRPYETQMSGEANWVSSTRRGTDPDPAPPRRGTPGSRSENREVRGSTKPILVLANVNLPQTERSPRISQPEIPQVMDPCVKIGSTLPSPTFPPPGFHPPSSGMNAHLENTNRLRSNRQSFSILAL